MEKTLDIWTDGAINIHAPNKPGGWSSVYVYDNALVYTQWAGVAPTTSQQMELMGVIMGLENILNIEVLSTLQYNEIRIFSDSAYIINCMTALWYIEWKFNNWTTSSTGEPVKNREFWERLLNIIDTINKRGILITWHKVKGHCGLLYNEIADKLAVKAKKSVS